MVIMADFRAVDSMHLEVNRFYLDVYTRDLGQPVHVFAERKHLEKLLAGREVSYRYPFSFYKPFSRNPIIRVYLRELVTIVRLLRVMIHARRNRAQLLHILCASHLAHFSLRVLMTLLPPRCSVLLSFHGELELLAAGARRIWQPGFWLALSLKISVKRLYALVLGGSITAELARLGFGLTDVIDINLPYDFSEPSSVRKDTGRTLIVGLVGSANVTKNSHLIYRLADRFDSEIAAGIISFRIVGRVDYSLAPYANSRVEADSSGGLRDKEEFESRVMELDAVLYFYAADSYLLTASGALFDAVKFNKPIIAFENRYFQLVMRNAPEGIVSWVSNLEETELVIRRWLLSGCPAVAASAYDSVRKTHSFANVGAAFVRQLREKGILA